MTTFPDAPDTDPFKDDDDVNDTDYVLRSAYTYVTLAGQTIVVPEGFKTDEVSTPRIMWTIIGMPPDGFYRAAGVVHDYLYSTNGDNGVFTRQQSDTIILEIMTRLGVGWFKRNAAYLAVRLFGASHWKGN